MKSPPEKKLVVFDMDGVIIDVSRSYRDTVRKTARLFLKGAHGWQDLPDPLFSLSDLSHVKQSGGLNNDWDLTYRVLHLLFSQVACPSWEDVPSGYQRNLACCDVSALAGFLVTADTPLARLLAERGWQDDPFVAAMSAGDVGKGNIIKQIFQEIYLGPALFTSTYGMTPEFYRQDGLIDRERLIATASTLESLSGGNILAVATGRPQAEADYPLDLHGIGKYFHMVLTLDQCLEAEKKIQETEGRHISLSKPHPFMLDAVFQRLRQNRQLPKDCGAFYVGDMPDDMIAAVRSRAGFIGIGFTFMAPDEQVLRRRLLQAGACRVVEDFASLTRLLARTTADISKQPSG